MATTQQTSKTPTRASKRVTSRGSRVSGRAGRVSMSGARGSRRVTSVRRVRTRALRSGRTAQELATAATRRRREVMLNVAKRDGGPTLWPEDATGINSLSERVVINVEHASFVLSWTLLSAIVTAIGIVLLLRAPLVF